MRRRGGSGVGLGNPFVVFVDVTVTLAFVVLVYAIHAVVSSNQLLMDFDRNDRQIETSKALVNGYQAAAGAPVRTETYEKPQVKGQWIYAEGRTEPIGQIRENASYLRVTLYVPHFFPGEARLTPDGDRMLSDLADSLRARCRDFEYIYFHGISSEPGLSLEAQYALSRERAQKVFGLFQREKVVQSYDEFQVDRGQPKDKISLRYAICYGTAAMLYADEAMNNRVDIMLFFTDASKNP